MHAAAPRRLADVLRLAAPLSACLGFAEAWRLAACAALPLRAVLIRLPMGLRAYALADHLPAALRNALHVFYYGDYEVLGDFAPREGWTVLDVGAFIGLWALRAYAAVGEGGRVIALEPNPRAHALCAFNLQINGARRARALPLALSASSGRATLYVPECDVNASLREDYARLFSNELMEVRVRTITLEQLLKRLGVRRVDLMKVDVEGHELDVLSAFSRDAAARVKRLVVEVHTDVVSTHEVSEALESLGYSVAVYVDESLKGQAFVYAKRGS